jgi:hypothetical protein
MHTNCRPVALASAVLTITLSLPTSALGAPQKSSSVEQPPAEDIAELRRSAAAAESKAEFEKAERIWNQALELSERLHGKGSEIYASTLGLLRISRMKADLWRARYQGGKGFLTDLAERLLKAQREVLGERHPDTIDTLHTFSSYLTKYFRHGEAVKSYMELIRLCREVFGERDVRTGLAVGGFAWAVEAAARELEGKEQWSEARALRAQLFDATLQTYGKGETDTVDALNRYVDTLYLSKGDLLDAAQLEEILRLRRAGEGDTAPDTQSRSLQTSHSFT